jgi:coproporphyrinogen III oxidase-like Fe-S oxidoreductase
MSEGLNLEHYKHYFAKDLLDSRAKQIEALAQQGLLEVSSTTLKISQKGQLITDSIIASLLTGESK